jgi:hypothetical protein
MHKLITVILLMCFLCGSSQDNPGNISTSDSSAVSESPILRSHSTGKATLFSAVLPGAGQAYNRKYWKVPIVMVGIGTCIYFIQDNSKNYHFYKDNLIAELDDDPTTVNTTDYTSSQLDQIQDLYRRWRDVSWICLGAVYILNIIDANVDAHLFYFDVGDDLSLRIHPNLVRSAGINAGFSLSLNF